MKVWSGNWDIILIFKICHSIISKCAFICPTFHGMSFIFALQHQFCLIVNYTNQDNSRNVQFNNGGIKITIEFCRLPCWCAWGSFILKCTLFSTKNTFTLLRLPGNAFFELNQDNMFSPMDLICAGTLSLEPNVFMGKWPRPLYDKILLQGANLRKCSDESWESQCCEDCFLYSIPFVNIRSTLNEFLMFLLSGFTFKLRSNKTLIKHSC